MKVNTIIFVIILLFTNSLSLLPDEENLAFFEDEDDDTLDDLISLENTNFVGNWNCNAMKDIGIIIRYYHGNIECLSTNAIDCIWGAKFDECGALVSLFGFDKYILACGEMHKRIHGTIGYGFPNHWCEKAAKRYYPFVKHPITSSWRCDLLKLLGVIVRYVDGDIECLSHNGKDCIWNTTHENCLFLTKDEQQLNLINCLRCGEMHNEKYPGPGYNIPNHWCAKALKLYKD